MVATTYVMPSAAEQLRAEEAAMAVDWRELTVAVNWFVAGLISIAVRTGPRYCSTCPPGGPCCGMQYDPLEDVGRTPEADNFVDACRALGVL